MLSRRVFQRGAAAALCALPFARASAAEAEAVLGIVPSGDFLPAIVAQRKGYFAAQGFPARIETISIISNIPAGLTSGSIQLGVTTGPTFVQAVVNGLDLVAVSGNSRFSPDVATATLVSRPDLAIPTAADLAGKRIAVPGLNSLLDLLLRRWLIARGVDPAQTQLVEAAFTQMGDMLRAGRVDLAIMKEPFAGRAVSTGAAKPYADYIKEVDPNGLNVFWIALGSWGRANREACAKFRAALEQGFDFVRKDPEARTIEQEVLHSRTDVLPRFDTRLTADDLRFELELSRQFGLIDATPVDVSRLLVT